MIVVINRVVHIQQETEKEMYILLIRYRRGSLCYSIQFVYHERRSTEHLSTHAEQIHPPIENEATYSVTSSIEYDFLRGVGIHALPPDVR